MLINVQFTQKLLAILRKDFFWIIERRWYKYGSMNWPLLENEENWFDVGDGWWTMWQEFNILKTDFWEEVLQSNAQRNFKANSNKRGSLRKVVTIQKSLAIYDQEQYEICLACWHINSKIISTFSPPAFNYQQHKTFQIKKLKS